MAVSTVSEVPNPRLVACLVRAGVADVFHASSPAGLHALINWVIEHRPLALHVVVWRTITMYVPTRAESLFKRTLRLAHAPVAVGALADSCGCSERTLRRLCKAAGLPGALWLISMARLASAGFLLEHAGMKLHDVVNYLDYESPEHFRQSCVTWTAHTPRRLLGAGWIQTIGQIISNDTDLGGHPNPATSGHLKTGHQRRAET